MEKRIPASGRLEQAIGELVETVIWDPDRLAALGRLGTKLVIQRAIEDEVDEFLGRAHYQRTLDARRVKVIPANLF